MEKQLKTERQYRPLYMKSLDPRQGDDENYIIRGVFSTGDEDRQGEVLVQAGLDISEFMLNPVMLFAHDHWQPAVGKVTELYLNEDGNWEGAVQFAAKEYDFAAVLYQLYKNKYMRAFSMSFDVFSERYDQENDRAILEKTILYEISAVNVGAVKMALAKSKGIDVSPLERYQKYQAKIREKIMADKSAACRLEGESEQDCVSRKIPELVDEGYEQSQAEAIAYSICGKRCGEKKKAAVPYADHGTAPEDESWDGPGEIVKCGDDMEKLKSICTWYNAEEPEVKSSYKLPHHKADGMKAVWKGVAAAMAALLGARGGVDIPEKDKQAVYNHLAKHYKQFDKEVPELKSYTDEEIIQAIESLSQKDIEKVKGAKRTLTDVLKTSKRRKVVKKISVKDINQAIRSLLKVRDKIKEHIKK
jgi:HK97 family phage prohead protease